MNKQLNIKNGEARELAEELARLTGETITDAVTRALRERVERERTRRPRPTPEEVARQMAVIRHIREQGRKFREKGLSSDHDWLYDEDGLPA